MRVLVAFDKFKDALSARETCEIAIEAIQKCRPEWEVETAPLADGGDGFCDTLTGCLNGEFHEATVSGPLVKKVNAQFGIVSVDRLQKSVIELLNWNSDLEKIAVIELAESSGISLTPLENRSPWTTTTAGLGEVIQSAINYGANGAVVGLGGSATHDLALGALWKLGFRFIDKNGVIIDRPPTPENWPTINRIEARSTVLPKDFELRVACDVENPLLGPMGAAAIFGPQKGLVPSRYDALESATSHMAKMLCNACSTPYATMEQPGTGAAGGAAFGLKVGLGAQIVPGYELVKNWIGLNAKFERADIVITGEGRFDASSLQGKGPGALALESIANNKQLFVFAGSLGELETSGFPTESTHAISPIGMPLAEALQSTGRNLQRAILSAFGN
jgi:glycerate kinase